MPDRSTAASSVAAKLRARAVASGSSSGALGRRRVGGRRIPRDLVALELRVRAVGDHDDHRVLPAAQRVGGGRQRAGQVGAGVGGLDLGDDLAEQRLVAAEPRQRRGLRVDAHHHRLIAAAHRVDQRDRALLGPGEARQLGAIGIAVGGAHRRRGVEQDDDVAGAAIGDAQGRRLERRDDQPDDRQRQQERQPAPQLLPQRVGVALLEDPLPQARERHLEAAPPHLQEVGDDDQPGRDQRGQADGAGRQRGQPGHRRKPPERKMRKTSSSNGRPVWVRKNGTARWVQKSSSSLQYFSCSRV